MTTLLNDMPTDKQSTSVFVYNDNSKDIVLKISLNVKNSRFSHHNYNDTSVEKQYNWNYFLFYIYKLLHVSVWLVLIDMERSQPTVKHKGQSK